MTTPCTNYKSLAEHDGCPACFQTRKLLAYAKARDVLVGLLHERAASGDVLEFGREALRRLYREFYDETGALR